MKAICWAYTEDGRGCRQPATSFDQQRGFMVCAAHSVGRENQTQTQDSIMSKATKTPPNGSPGASAPNDQPTYRSNPEVDARIDAYIKENPKFWTYVQGLPRERLERMIVLHEVQKLDRQQRIRESVMKQINRNPELKQAYDLLVKNVPADQKENVLMQIASRTQRILTRTQGRVQAQAVAD